LINTVIIDAQQQDREKISSLLTAREDIKILAIGYDAYDALKLITCHKPDIVILNNNLEYIEGDEIPPLIKMRSPNTAVVILISQITDNQLYKAVINRVSAFVSIENDLDMLPGILSHVAKGEYYISQSLASRFLQLLYVMNPKNLMADHPVQSPFSKLTKSEGPADSLSKTELRIICCIRKNFSSKEIAGELGLAVGTVRNHISSIMRKTGIRNRPGIACYACHKGLIPANLPPLQKNKSA